MDTDPTAIDTLVALFAECRELGIAVPDDMPLDTPAHQRAACTYLSRLTYMEKKQRGTLT